MSNNFFYIKINDQRFTFKKKSKFCVQYRNRLKKKLLQYTLTIMKTSISRRKKSNSQEAFNQNNKSDNEVCNNIAKSKHSKTSKQKLHLEKHISVPEMGLIEYVYVDKWRQQHHLSVRSFFF